MFDLTVVTAAFCAADAAESTFDAMKAEMVTWHEGGAYPERADLIAAVTASGRKESTAKVYASRILAWAKAGKLPATMHALVADGPKTTGKGGRPKGKGKGKTTAAPVKTAAPADDLAVTLQGLIAKAAKLVGAADVARFQDAIIEAIACLKRARS